MIGTPLDAIAWASRWRSRSVAEKVALCGGLMACALVLPPWSAAPAVLLAVGAAARHAGVTIFHLLRMLRLPAVFIVAAGVSTAFTLDPAGPTLATSGEALMKAGTTVGRSIAATAAMMLFASTTPMSDLTDSLRRIGLPAPCVDVISVMYRMIFLLLESVVVVRKSQTSRLGYSNARRSVRSAGLLTAAVLARAWERARTLERGLSGRNFGTTMVRPEKPFVSVTFMIGAAATNAFVAALSLTPVLVT